jgi:NAD(P)-dependent dehydrogenase (short-subunit alcohol dehydrogenase family)
MSTWFVTGAASGFGAEIVKRTLARGHNVAATARDVEKLRASFSYSDERLLPLAADVTRQDQIVAAVDAAVDHFGSLDVVVNNAAQTLFSAIEEASEEEVKSIYDVNVFGVLRVLRAVLPVLRNQRSGHIINISSSMGFNGSTPGMGIYSSTKFAVEGISEALHTELSPLGVNVTIVEPGLINNGAVANMRMESNVIADYEKTSGAMRSAAALGDLGIPGSDPERCAASIVKMAESKTPPFRLVLGSVGISGFNEKMASAGNEFETRYVDTDELTTTRTVSSLDLAGASPYGKDTTLLPVTASDHDPNDPNTATTPVTAFSRDLVSASPYGEDTLLFPIATSDHDPDNTHIKENDPDDPNTATTPVAAFSRDLVSAYIKENDPNDPNTATIPYRGKSENEREGIRKNWSRVY